MNILYPVKQYVYFWANSQIQADCSGTTVEACFRSYAIKFDPSPEDYHSFDEHLFKQAFDEVLNANSSPEFYRVQKSNDVARGIEMEMGWKVVKLYRQWRKALAEDLVRQKLEDLFNALESPDPYPGDGISEPLE